VVPEDVGEIA